MTPTPFEGHRAPGDALIEASYSDLAAAQRSFAGPNSKPYTLHPTNTVDGVGATWVPRS